MTNSKPAVPSVALALKQKELRVQDIVAPEHIETDFDYFKINDVYFRTIFVAGYPRFVTPGWLEPVVNFDSSLDISFYIYPVDGKSVLDDLRRKIAEMEAEMSTDLQRGKIVDPVTEAKLEDARTIQEQLVKGAKDSMSLVSISRFPPQLLKNLITPQNKSSQRWALNDYFQARPSNQDADF